MSAAQPPPTEPAVRSGLDLVTRRLPLLERAVELAGASLVGLRARLGKLGETIEADPRQGLAARIERLEQELGMLRRQIMRLAGRSALGGDGSPRTRGAA